VFAAKTAVAPQVRASFTDSNEDFPLPITFMEPCPMNRRPSTHAMIDESPDCEFPANAARRFRHVETRRLNGGSLRNRQSPPIPGVLAAERSPLGRG